MTKKKLRHNQCAQSNVTKIEGNDLISIRIILEHDIHTPISSTECNSKLDVILENVLGEQLFEHNSTGYQEVARKFRSKNEELFGIIKNSIVNELYLNEAHYLTFIEANTLEKGLKNFKTSLATMFSDTTREILYARLTLSLHKKIFPEKYSALIEQLKRAVTENSERTFVLVIDQSNPLHDDAFMTALTKKMEKLPNKGSGQVSELKINVACQAIIEASISPLSVTTADTKNPSITMEPSDSELVSNQFNQEKNDLSQNNCVMPEKQIKDDFYEAVIQATNVHDIYLNFNLILNHPEVCGVIVVEKNDSSMETWPIFVSPHRKPSLWKRYVNNRDAFYDEDALNVAIEYVLGDQLFDKCNVTLDSATQKMVSLAMTDMGLDTTRIYNEVFQIQTNLATGLDHFKKVLVEEHKDNPDEVDFLYAQFTVRLYSQLYPEEHCRLIEKFKKICLRIQEDETMVVLSGPAFFIRANEVFCSEVLMPTLEKKTKKKIRPNSVSPVFSPLPRDISNPPESDEQLPGESLKKVGSCDKEIATIEKAPSNANNKDSSDLIKNVPHQNPEITSNQSPPPREGECCSSHTLRMVAAIVSTGSAAVAVACVYALKNPMSMSWLTLHMSPAVILLSAIGSMAVMLVGLYFLCKKDPAPRQGNTDSQNFFSFFGRTLNGMCGGAAQHPGEHNLTI